MSGRSAAQSGSARASSLFGSMTDDENYGPAPIPEGAIVRQAATIREGAPLHAASGSWVRDAEDEAEECSAAGTDDERVRNEERTEPAAAAAAAADSEETTGRRRGGNVAVPGHVNLGLAQAIQACLFNTNGTPAAPPGRGGPRGHR